MSKICCVFAHPDDEAFGPGGTIAKLAAENEVDIICCTDGDVENNGLRDVRDKELLASAKILGVRKVYFLGFTDGSLSNGLYHKLAEKIKDKLDEIRPETIITFDPNGVSGHIDHITVTSVVNWLFSKLPCLKKIMYYCMKERERVQIGEYFVYVPPGRSRSEVDWVVGTTDVWETKIAAMRAHVSQKADCDRVLAGLSGQPKEEWFLLRSKSE